jgi:O-antigen ligase
MERTNPYLNNVAYYLLMIFAVVLMLSNALAETLAVIIILIWLAQSIAYRRKEWLNYPLFLPLVSLMIFKALVLLVSGYQGKPGAAFEQIALPLIYFVVPPIVVTFERRWTIIWLFITGAVLVSGISLIQFLLGLTPVAVSIISGPYTLAIFLGIALSLLLVIFAYQQKLSEKIFTAFIALPLFAALIFTITRTLYFVVGLMILILGIFKDRKLFVPFIVVIPMLYLFFPGSVAKIYDKFDYSSTRKFYSHRDRLIETGLAKVNEVDFFGHGINSFPVVAEEEIEAQKLSSRLTGWHNMYIETLLDGGPFALIILLWVLLAQVRYSWIKFRKTQDRSQKIYQLSMLLLIMCLILVGILDNPLSDQIIAMAVWMLLGLSVI